ncbi:hypothetical protein [Clostridium sp. ZS2-4]|uniref:hypothetical protein n=1 Tax=Clostridium sp. ZS2-4 TaxID=2987703 RepID=UPI00227C1D0F|nr:hypothetical protein [Clostridium sp. ZS2-4]MCY6354062.1 hypothetical protein [Clostridium sp. ZS2-4]
MFKKDILLKVGSNKINSFEVCKKHKLVNLHKVEEVIDVKDFKNLKIRIRNKNIYIIIEGEEIYVKYMQLPKVYGEQLDKVIQNQLIYLYGSKAEEIFYSYAIFKEKQNELEVLVFCVNCEELNEFKNFTKHNSVIKKVDLVQFCFLNYFKRYILDSNYIFMFKYNENLYLIAVAENKIMADKVVKDSGENYEIIMREYDYLKEKILSLHIHIDKIYCVNFYNLKFEEHMENEKDFKYIDLGKFDEAVIAQAFVCGRR